MADPRSVLDPLPVDNGIKADAWDAFQQAASPDDFKARFDKLQLPNEAKASLWDLKFSTPAAPQIPGMEKLGGALPLMPAASAAVLPGALRPDARTPVQPLAPQPPQQFTGAPRSDGQGNLPSAHEAAALADAQVQATMQRLAQQPAAVPGMEKLGALPAAGVPPMLPQPQQQASSYNPGQQDTGVSLPPGAMARIDPESFKAAMSNYGKVLPPTSEKDPTLTRVSTETARFALNLVSPDSLAKYGLTTAGFEAVPALANLPAVAQLVAQRLGPAGLKAVDVMAHSAPGAALIAKQVAEQVKAGMPKTLEQAVDATLNGFLVAAGMWGTVSGARSVLGAHPGEADVTGPASTRAATQQFAKDANVTPPMSPQQVATAQATGEALAGQGRNIAAQDWFSSIKNNAPMGDVTNVQLGSKTYTVTRTQFREGGKSIDGYQLRDPDGSEVISGTASQVKAWIDRNVGTRPNPTGTGRMKIGDKGVEFEGPPEQTVSRTPAASSVSAPAPARPSQPQAEANPEAPPAPERWQAGDRQHEIRPLTEQVYDESVVPAQKVPIPFAQYQAQNPDVTHASFERTGDGEWKYAGLGALEDLRPAKGKEVTGEWPETPGVKPIRQRGPISLAPAAAGEAPTLESPIPKRAPVASEGEPLPEKLRTADGKGWQFPTAPEEQEAKTARGTVIKTRLAVVPAQELITSHDTALNVNPEFPAEVQPRDRSRAASEAQITSIAGNLDPKELAPGYQASTGAPIVGTDGVVESGNGRVIALRRLYDSNHANGQNYRTWMLGELENHGFTPEQIKQAAIPPDPVLVRVRVSPTDDRGALAGEMNENSVARMSESEQAAADAGHLDQRLMALFSPAEDGDVAHAGNRHFVRGFFDRAVSPGELGHYMTSEGTLSQAGVRRVRNAIFAKAYGTGGALERMAESPDDAARNVTSGMVQAAGHVAALDDAIRAGTAHPLSIAPEATAAAEKLAALRGSGQSVPDYIAQVPMFGADLSPDARVVLRLFDLHKHSSRRIGALLREYTRAVLELGDPHQQTLAGTSVPGTSATKRGILEAAAKETEEQHGTAQSGAGGDLFRGSEGESEPPAGPAAAKPDEEAGSAGSAPQPAPGRPGGNTGGAAVRPQDLPPDRGRAPGAEAPAKPTPTVALGTTRNIGHGVETLERIPLSQIIKPPPPENRPQGNVMYPDRVEEYRSGARKTDPVELRKERDGRYSIWEGNHRVDAARLRGETHILAWTLEGKPQLPGPPPPPAGLLRTPKGAPASGAQTRAKPAPAGHLEVKRGPALPAALGELDRTPAAPQPAAQTELSGRNAPAAAPVSNDTAALLPGTEKLFNRILEAVEKGEDLRLSLERIAEQTLGGTRAAGSFEKQDLYEIQEAAVNRWLAQHGARLLAMPFDAAVAELRGVVGKLASQTVRSAEKIGKQQFSTPPQLAYLVDRLLNPQAADRVLEPSAGIAGLVAMLRDRVAAIHLNEIDPRRRALAELALNGKVATSTAVDGENLNALLERAVKPTAIAMNPPFSAGVVKSGDARNRNKYGLNHVEHALQRLEPGGRAVIILGGGQHGGFHESDGAALTATTYMKFWQGIAARYNIRANVRIAGKEYQRYGTGYDTRVVIIDKTGPTPGATWLDKVASVKRGEYSDVESAWKDLATLADERSSVTPEQSHHLGQRESPALQQSGLLFGGDSGAPAEIPADGGRRVRPAGEGPRVEAEGRPAGSRAGSGSQRADADAAAAGDRSPAQSARRTQPERIKLTRRAELRPEEDTGAFVNYEPTITGPAHPGPIVETKAMSTIALPPLSYEPLLPPFVVDEGRLSATQLEAVTIAGQQNETVLPDGARGAALIGDGTGTGKGRTGAAIAWDNWNRGRKRIVFVSKSWDLAEDLKRDLSEDRGIGAGQLAGTVKRLDKWAHADKLQHEGIIFAPYSTVRGVDKKGNARVAQLAEWLAGDGSEGLAGVDGALVIFDESHLLKSTTPGERAVASQVGTAVAKMLHDLPALRTVFLSATAASEVQNMGYLSRLGLWGPQTAFPNGFPEFSARIGSQGLSAMELIARELKAQGKYLARTLSMKGVEFRQVDVPLNDDQKAIYATAAETWADVLKWVQAGLETTNARGSASQRAFMQQFYGSAQRFFNVLITALKTPAAIEQAEKALAAGRAPVISLVNTLGTVQDAQEAKLRAGEADEEELDFGPRDVLLTLVQDYFPTQQYRDDVDPNGKPMKVPVTQIVDGREVPVTNPEAERQRDELLAKLKAELHLPGNPLDIMIEHFGGENVAELSGRKKRWDATKAKFVKRGGEDTPQHQVNLAEMKAFQDGKKKVALVTSAADTGISLHSDLKAKNQNKRTHITLQFGWSADKQMQMYGRTNRTNQAHPPEYIILVSDLAGEKRFVSTIAKRLKSLGAITRGSSQASGGTDEMANLDLDSREGRQASTSFHNRMLADATLPGTEVQGRELLDRMGVLVQTPTGPQVRNPENVNRLLNRILMLKPALQRAAYDYFFDIFEGAVAQALEEGTLDTGVKELKGTAVSVAERRVLGKDPQTGAETVYYPVDVTNRNELVFPDKLEKLMARHPDWRLMRDGHDRLIFAVPTAPITRATGEVLQAVRGYVPTGKLPQKLEERRLSSMTDLRAELEERVRRLEGDISQAANMEKYLRGAVDRYAAREREAMQASTAANKAGLATARAALQNYQEHVLKLWQEAVEKEPQTVTERHHLIGGAVLRHWGLLGNEMDGVYLAQDTASGDRVVGAAIPGEGINDVLRQISGRAQTVTSAQVFDDVLRNGTAYDLENGVRVVRGSVARNPVVELKAGDERTRRNLVQLGATLEKGIVPKVYVPSSNAGRGILQAIIASYPVRVLQGLAGDTSGSASIDFLTLRPVRDLLAARIARMKTGPQEEYSATGRLRDLFVGNLHELGEAAPKARELAARTSGSRAQASALIRIAVPRVIAALKRNDGPSWTKFRELLIESRLQGIRRRWKRMARAVARFDDKKLHASFEAGNLLPLLRAVEGEWDIPPASAERCAALLESQQYARLRRYLQSVFEQAALHVAHVMPEQEFAELKDTPGVRAGLTVYKNFIERVLAESHALNEGIFSNALGPLDTYYPLIPVRELDPIGAAIAAKTPYRAPRNLNNEFATGLALHYDTDMQLLAQKIERAFRSNNKAGLIHELQDIGLLHVLEEGERVGTTMAWRGVEYSADTIETGGGFQRNQKNGRLVYAPVKQAVVPSWLKRELQPILERKDRAPGRLRSLITAVNYASLVGIADAAWHARNLVGTLVSNTPYIGAELGVSGRLLANLPLTKMIGAQIELARTDPATDRAAREFADMARIGALPDKFGHEVYAWTAWGRDYAEATGATPRKWSVSPFLYGPKGIDGRARLYMYRLAKRLDPNVSDAELRDFVNQLGAYSYGLETPLERWLKGTGIGPFATAGRQMTLNGVRAATGTGPLPGASWRSRLLRLITGGIIGALALWVFGHKTVTGKYPWQDRKSQFMAIPVPASWRATAIGRALWGRKPGTAYLRLDYLLPLVTRGMRALGVADYYNAKKLHATTGQALGHALAGPANAILHPAVTGPIPRAATILATGREAHVTSVVPLDAMPATKATKPGFATLGARAGEAALGLNPFVHNIARAAGLGWGPEFGDSRVRSGWVHAVAKQATDYGAPGLIGQPTNLQKRTAYMLREAKKKTP